MSPIREQPVYYAYNHLKLFQMNSLSLKRYCGTEQYFIYEEISCGKWFKK